MIKSKISMSFMDYKALFPQMIEVAAILNIDVAIQSSIHTKIKVCTFLLFQVINLTRQTEDFFP